jgi:hypothetical protein
MNANVSDHALMAWGAVAVASAYRFSCLSQQLYCSNIKHIASMNISTRFELYALTAVSTPLIARLSPPAIHAAPIMWISLLPVARLHWPCTLLLLCMCRSTPMQCRWRLA